MELRVAASVDPMEPSVVSAVPSDVLETGTPVLPEFGPLVNNDPVIVTPLPSVAVVVGDAGSDVAGTGPFAPDEPLTAPVDVPPSVGVVVGDGPVVVEPDAAPAADESPDVPEIPTTDASLVGPDVVLVVTSPVVPVTAVVL